MASSPSSKSGGQRPGSVRAFEELFELAFQFLATPSKLWGSGKLEYRKLVLRLTFADHLAWCPDEGLLTPKTTLPFNMLGDPDMGNCGMAEEEQPDANLLLEFMGIVAQFGMFLPDLRTKQALSLRPINALPSLVVILNDRSS